MRSFHHFTLEERERLHEAVRNGKSQTEIAKMLNRNQSSISREIKRNTNKDGSYMPYGATLKYIIRRKKSVRRLRIAQDAQLAKWIINKLECYWPPETIVAIWKKENPGAKLGFSTIYLALKRRLLEECTPKRNLRRRGKRKYKQDGRYNTIKPDHTIHQRPEQANARKEIGHFEGDTIVGGKHSGLIVTCVDRMSRYLLVAPAANKQAQTVADAMKKACEGTAIASLTLDNGAEFANHRELSQVLNTTIYFADPHSPWQRGSNENMNGLLRFFFPKGMDLRQVSAQEIQEVADLINDRPRKCLNWLSPRDVFANHSMLSMHLT